MLGEEAGQLILYELLCCVDSLSSWSMRRPNRFWCSSMCSF